MIAGSCDPADYISLGCVDGFDFSASSKKNLIEHARNVMSVGYRSGSDEPFGHVRIPPISKIEEEHSFYSWDDKRLETDTVMGLALALWQGMDDVPQSPLFGSVHGG